MIEDTITKIEARLLSSESLAADKKAELTGLFAQLRREARGLPADAPPGNNEDIEDSVRRLQESVAGFESTHPQLVGVVNRISTVLANMGI